MVTLAEGIQSRRALLGGGLGALAALVVQALTRPLPVAAADVVLGGQNTTNGITRITNTAGTGFRGTGTSVGVDGRASNSTGLGVYGVVSGVSGEGVRGTNSASSGDAVGVSGRSSSPDGKGVEGLNFATTGDAAGVHGRSASGAGFAVFGLNTATSNPAIGVYGESRATAGVGVRGYVPANVVGSGGYGVLGETESPVSVGVAGRSPGIGMLADGDTQTGIWAMSDHGHAVLAQARAALKAGVVAHSTLGTGVAGYSGASTYDQPNDIGVLGQCNRNATSMGVLGKSTIGTAVRGETDSGVAVKAEATGTGRALETVGPVRFSSAGLDIIATGTNAKQVTPGVDLNSQSKVLVTLNGNPGTGISMHRVGINGTTDQFTVFLTGNATADAKFSWFVIS
jgi:hypothetical protein